MAEDNKRTRYFIENFKFAYDYSNEYPAYDPLLAEMKEIEENPEKYAIRAELKKRFIKWLELQKEDIKYGITDYRGGTALRYSVKKNIPKEEEEML